MDATQPDDDDAPPARFQVDFTGRTLGAYRVERRIAEGGMGGVYLAEDTTLGMRVVVKVPHARFLGEPGFRGRFRREVAELVRLEHPHVVRILARGEDEQVPYFVLQYLGGGSLEERLKSGGRQRLEGALAWLRPIAATLDFVHARGVVHRDVKPGNILFDEAGHVFLSDFGLVKALGPRDEGRLTEAGTGIGSPLYMAPEQALGKEVSGAADQYGLASTLYEALVGAPPFARETFVESLLAKQRDPAPSARDAVPDLPPSADAAIRRALSPDPAARFPSCAAFAAAVATAVDAAVPVPAARPRSRAPTIALLAAIAIGAGAYAVFRPGGGAAPAAPPEAEGGALVVLAKPGAEPRAARRFRLEAGTVDRVVFESKERTKAPPVFRPFMPASMVRTQEAEVRVAGLEADGRARLDWTLRPPTIDPGEGLKEADVAYVRKTSGKLGSMSAVAAVAPRGEILSADLVVDPALPREAMRYLPAYEEGLRSFEFVFPKDPIGVGAVWDVTTAATTMGIRYQQTTTYELVAVEDGRLRLTWASRMGAPPQDFRPPGASEGETVKIPSMTSTGSGAALVDLSRPAPIEWTNAQDVTMTMEFPPRAPGEPATSFDFVLSFASTLRRP